MRQVDWDVEDLEVNQFAIRLDPETRAEVIIKRHRAGIVLATVYMNGRVIYNNTHRKLSVARRKTAKAIKENR